jgi:hypothetical protein
MAKTREERIAQHINDTLADIRVDGYMVGFYLAHTPEPHIYEKIEEVFDSAKLVREERQERIKNMILGIDNDTI